MNSTRELEKPAHGAGTSACPATLCPRGCPAHPAAAGQDLAAREQQLQNPLPDQNSPHFQWLHRRIVLCSETFAKIPPKLKKKSCFDGVSLKSWTLGASFELPRQFSHETSSYSLTFQRCSKTEQLPIAFWSSSFWPGASLWPWRWLCWCKRSTSTPGLLPVGHSGRFMRQNERILTETRRGHRTEKRPGCST